ncbi:hypothetical protein SYNPS1DRAFT_12499 [Syncephalis pseudoplumigaleata]|uniref:Protoporphyrinogen oxidase n=1 Tax=Syncephalis pseudoplumigaleata TaxID=1712513 RepID=A0A4P9Z4P7_9FUNG|nr:hypothetical protein SYNPS1DRAFT_12499 [Syncephalis pseudoplumigaleata]|eukprot:RKP27553.1 hypothetical protein SYNPS1DRAFT_12499 [Syncephalis pseudoplumigaleata]
MTAPPRHIVVLGGGISGLSVAYHLLRSSSAVRVTLVEATQRLGGWVHSRAVTAPDSNTALVCETGPRTLRPAGEAGLATLQLVKALALDDALVAIPPTAAAAKNRFLYGDGQLHLLRPWSIMRSRYVRPIVWPMMREPFRAASGPVETVVAAADGTSMTVEDESIRSFMTRRFSPYVADHLVSAVVSGIYAGDIGELSARACFGALWHAERKHHSLVRGVWAGRHGDAAVAAQRRALLDPATTSLELRRAATSSVYTFDGGIQTLTDAMARALEQQHAPHRYALHLNKACQSITMDKHAVQLEDGTRLSADQVVSTVPARHMNRLLGPGASTWFGQVGMAAANVAVVNLVYAGRLPIPDGFGYLIPITEANTAALGVVFDSQAVSPELAATADASRYTRLTVMLGGRYRWGQQQLDRWTDDDFLQHALETVRRHLHIEDRPIYELVSVHRQCIPQYQVGHIARVRALHEDLSRQYHGRLAVTGASYLGVSINDCIWRAEQLAHRMAAPSASDNGAAITTTGLEAAASL